MATLSARVGGETANVVSCVGKLGAEFESKSFPASNRIERLLFDMGVSSANAKSSPLLVQVDADGMFEKIRAAYSKLGSDAKNSTEIECVNLIGAVFDAIVEHEDVCSVEMITKLTEAYKEFVAKAKQTNELVDRVVGKLRACYMVTHF